MNENIQPKEKRNYWLLLLKGCAMGAADVVPGVSGGTIAFITGIYEELLESIKSLNFNTLKMLLSFRFRDFWETVNGSFLVTLLSGIGLAVFSLAKVMTFLLENHPIYIWSFFFGLIIASSILVSKEIKKWTPLSIVSLLAGAAIAYSITVLSPSETPDSWWFIILSGSIAICAMILPGISGSFLLLLLGKYSYIMTAVHQMDLGILALFAFGAAGGIIGFSHVLTWLLKNFHTVTISLLTGFMVGSLNKIWPWKETISTYIDRHGVEKVLQESNISPQAFETLTGKDPLILQAVVMCLIGFFLIWGIEALGNKMQKKS